MLYKKNLKEGFPMTASERFLNYVLYPTMSDESSPDCPSTKKQLSLAGALVGELAALGLTDARADEHGYVYATLPATAEAKNVIGFIAHMDTSDAAPDSPIRPRRVIFDGSDIVLNEKENIVLSPSVYPCLNRYKGQELIVTDGTTLLGADDKAGIAEIMTMLEKLKDVPHGTIRVAFTPDEEIGRGADLFDVPGFAADYAYTVDGGAIGEFEYENFNAASAKVIFHGISIHPGSAKGLMKNACLMALAFDSLLPADEIPSKTEGREGFHHLCDMKGSIELAELDYIIRDHDRAKFEEKKEQFRAAVGKINAEYGPGSAEIELRDSYYNMKEIIESHPETVERALAAMRETGIEPVVVPIRGGTDGARLSFMGLPCPNLCTGGENYHSRFEFIPTESMEKISGLLVRIAEDLVEG